MSKKRSRRLSEAERAERRAAERERMARAVEDLASSEGWQRWLAVRARFHRYSFRNQLLIAFQRPGATRVAGFGDWLKLGYAVQKGETGIWIWAPCRPSKKKLREWEEAGADPKTRPKTFFRQVKVFDRAQVAPLADFPGGAAVLDPPSEPIAGEGLGHLFEVLCAFGEQNGSPIRIEPGLADGSYDPPSRAIRVNPVGPDFSPNAQVATAVHELCHDLVRTDRREEDPKLTYGEEEAVVECVAFMVCASVGLDTAANSVPYVTAWGKGGEIERYAELIDRLARRLEEAIDTAPAPKAAEEEMALAAAL